MKDWSSPYSAFASGLGLYIGGENYSGLLPDLDYVQSVNCYGWGQMPIWVGPQDPLVVSPHCQSTCSKFTEDPAGAFAVGQAEAAKAVSAMASLDWVTGIIYYDLENYAPKFTAADNNLVEGWVAGLHNAGFDAGIYGSPYNHADWLVANPPDYVWLTSANGNDNVYGVRGIPDGLWDNNRRIVQYAINQPNYTAPGGKLSYTVDLDVLDGEAMAEGAGFAVCLCNDFCDPNCPNYDPSNVNCQPEDVCAPCWNGTESHPSGPTEYCCSYCGVCPCDGGICAPQGI